MRFRLPIYALSAFTILTMGLVGCGGKGGSTPPPTPPAISVVLSAQPPSSLAISATASMTATVSNDSANAGVKWTATCGGSACGSFSPTSTASAAATTYTAPATIPSPATVTVTATSVSDSTKTASATITITAAVGPGISVSLSPQPPTSLVVGATSSLNAVVSNDSANAGVKWTATCGGSACGIFNPTATASGTATVYTAPTAIPTGGTVTVTATSVTDSTKSASATITIDTILADGTYVFNLSGQDSSGPYFVAGAFTVKNAAIIGGEQDFSDYYNGFSDVLVAAGCSLSVSGGNVQIVLATANTAIGVNGVETLRGARVSGSRTLLSEFDTFASASGSVDLQTGTAAPSGGYAFVVSGVDGSSNPYSLGIGGVLNVSGTTLSIGNSVFDYNDGGRFGQAQTFASGTVSAPDAYGRVSFNLVPSTASGLPGIIFTGYIVGPNRISLVEDPSDGLGADLGGTALGQGSNTDNFTPAMLGNTSYSYAAGGADVNGSSTIAGVFSFNSSGALTGQIALNDLSYFTNTTIGTTATYTVDPTGRATITNVIPASLTGANFTFQLYLDGNGNALQLGVDAEEVLSGPAYLQKTTTTDFEGSYALGAAGFLNVTGYPGWSATGPITVSSDAITGTTDYTVESVTPYPAVALTGTESSSTGALSLAGLNPANFATDYNYAYFRIDSTRVFAIEIDGQSLGLLTLEGTQ